MDNDSSIEAITPTALRGKYKEEHAKWFNAFYEAGFKNAQKTLKSYAVFLKDSSGFNDLTTEKKDSINKVANASEDYCKSTWVHP